MGEATSRAGEVEPTDAKNIVWLLLQLAVVPASVVCWVQASRGKAGERWTIGYLAAWAVLLLVVAPIAGMLDP